MSNIHILLPLLNGTKTNNKIYSYTNHKPTSYIETIGYDPISFYREIEDIYPASQTEDADFSLTQSKIASSNDP